LLSIEQLQDILHVPGTSNQNRLLLCLATTPIKPRTVAEITVIAAKAGWKASHVSKYLARATGLAISTPEGWRLTTPGKDHVAALAGQGNKLPVPKAIQSLREHAKKLKNADVRAFVEEAVACAENKLYRSAVVLSWVGAVAVLQFYVVAQKLTEFNAAGAAAVASSNSKNPNLKNHKIWRTAKTTDDLSLLKESEFLQLLVVIKVIGKNVKDELDGCLKLRNGCGHPNSLQVTETRVVAHVEMLIANVYDRF
jgi:hypothetical protein